MRVSINAHYLHRKMSGLARYAHQVYEAVQADGHCIIEVKPPYWFYRDGGSVRRILRFLALAAWEMLIPPVLLLCRRVDFHVSPAFSAPLGLLSSRYLVIVHDLAFIDHPDMYTRLERWYLGLNLFLLKIGRHTIIAPSEYVKGRICVQYGISAQRVHTVSPYSEFSLRAPEAKKLDRYFILLSNAHPRKNLQATVDGFLASAAFAEGYRLLVVGNFEQAVKADTDQVVVCQGVSDHQLEQLMSGATALVLFSLSEGFGFPIVEAASLGVVSMTSGVSSLAELSSPEAPHAIATQTHEIRAAFDRFVTDPAFRARLEADRLYVNSTFNRQSFHLGWQELLRGQ
jgi:hypothetical protein